MKFPAFNKAIEFLEKQLIESNGLVSLGLIGLYIYITRHESKRYTFSDLSKKTNISIKTLHTYIQTLESFNLIKRDSNKEGVKFNSVLDADGNVIPSKFYYSNAPLLIDNTINNTNTINTNSNMEILNKIIADLNKVSGRNFRLTATDTIKKINWLLSHGYTFDDFKKVHRVKLEWLKSEKMSAYYRPKTLYAQENFESYVNEKLALDPSKKTTTKWNDPDKQTDLKKRRAKLEEKYRELGDE